MLLNSEDLTNPRSRIAGSRSLLVGTVLVCLALWVRPAAAGPGVIVASRVEAFTAPSSEASVAAQFGQGAPICVLDETIYSGLLLHRVGWLAIRLPGGVGYVPVETVDVTAAAPEVVDCGAPEQAQDPGPAVRPPSASPLVAPPRPVLRRGRGRESAPAPAIRPALIAGGFLPLRPARFLLGMGSGVAWLDRQSAAEHQFDDSGVTFNGTLGLTIYDIFMISGSLAAVFPSDHASFSEEVVLQMGGGDPHTADSSLSVTSYSIAAGLRTPFWAIGPTDSGWIAAALFAQYGSAQIGAHRSISNCVDCREDSLHMPGGTFWNIGVDLLIPSHRPTVSYGLTASYQRYGAGAGFTDEVRVGFSCWLL